MTKNKALIFVFLCNLIWAGLGIIGRNIGGGGTFMQLSGGLASFVFGIFYIFLIGKKDILNFKNFKPNLFIFAILQSICGFSLFNAFSDKDLITSIAILLVNSSSLLVTFLAPILIREKTNLIELICAFVGFLGLFVFIMAKDGNLNSFSPTYGLWLSIIALIFNSLGSITNRKVSLQVPNELVALALSFGNMIVPILGFLIFPFRLSDLGLYDYLLGGGTGVITGFIAFLLLSRAYTKLKVQVISIVLLTQPILGGILGYVFLGEIFNLKMILGLIIVLASTLGIILVKGKE